MRLDYQQQCSLCHEVEGAIPYYYLPLPDKICLWCGNEEMCHKMTAHWRERSHWMNRDPLSPKLRREVWDGDRFEELSWF